MNVPASVQIVKPELPPLPSLLMCLTDGGWSCYSASPNSFPHHMSRHPNRTWCILEPTAPREPMSDEEMERIRHRYRGGLLFSLADIIRAVEAHHGIGREDGK